MTDADGTVVVLPDDRLPEVIARLDQAAERGGPVRIVIPIDSPLLLTAAEFRALKDASDEQRYPLLVRTADPLRLQLASRTGLLTEALPRARPVGVAPAPLPSRPAPPSRPEPADDNGEWPGPPRVIESDSSADAAAAWPVPSAAASLETEVISEAGIDEREQEAHQNPPRRWLPIVAALIALVTVAYFGIRYLVPSAAVRIVPKTAAAAESIAFDVTADGRPIDGAAAFVMTAQPGQIEVVWEGTIPVSGVRLEPDGSAEGPIELRNPSPDPATVEAGTVVTTETSVAFAIVADVIVPGADQAEGSAGATSATVRAVEAGSGGNVENGQLGGRLPNGVYYSNRMSPTAGGSDKEFPVVAEADFETLSAAAAEAAPGLAAAELNQIEAGTRLLTTTVQVADQKNEFDAAVGADAESVSLRSTLTLEFLTYDDAAARAQYEPLLLARLQDAVPAGYSIGPHTMRLEEPKETNGNPDQVRLGVAAEANAVAVLDVEERRRLVEQLAGLDVERAARVLEGVSEIESFRVDYQPAWLVRQMPANPDRIMIEVVG